MKSFIAILLCLTFSMIMVGVFGFVLGGGYQALTLGESIDESSMTEMFSPLRYRKLLIALIIAMGFSVFDILSLISHAANDAGSKHTPKRVPLGFAAVRLRRYFFSVFVLFYWGLICRCVNTTIPYESFITENAMYGFSGLYFLARRPLNMSVIDVLKSLAKMHDEIIDEARSKTTEVVLNENSRETLDWFGHIMRFHPPRLRGACLLVHGPVQKRSPAE